MTKKKKMFASVSFHPEYRKSSSTNEQLELSPPNNDDTFLLSVYMRPDGALAIRLAAYFANDPGVPAMLCKQIYEAIIRVMEGSDSYAEWKRLGRPSQPHQGSQQ